MSLTSITLTIFLSAQGADLGSTCGALRSGYVEANPLMPTTCAGQIAVKSAVSAGVLYGASRLHTRSPKAARWLLAGAAGVSAYATIRNLRTIR